MLLSHVLKVSKRMMVGRRMVRCETGEKQGFRRGRGTEDGMFTLRQLVGKNAVKATVCL